MSNRLQANQTNAKIWVFGTVVVALYGCFKKTSPESSYLTQYFHKPAFNFTKDQVDREIYPVTTYTNTVAVVLVILLTDFLRYKPVVVVDAAAILLEKALLVWGTSLLEIQASQFFLGIDKASTVAFKTYIYCITEKENYQIGTAITRIGTKFGFLFSSVLAQVGKSGFDCTTEDLIKTSFAVSVLGLICALLLPSPKKRLYFTEDFSPPEENSVLGPHESLYARTLKKIWRDLKEAYSDPYLLKWAIWWVLARGGHKLITSFYVQSLWNEISKGKENKYNAGVETIITVATIVSCYAVGSMKINWKVFGDLALTTSTLLQGVITLCNASADSLTVSYPLHATFIVLYDVTMLVAHSEVAKQMKSERFALVFGIQTFFAFCFNFLWTQLVVSRHGFALEIRDQFRFMGCVFLSVGVGYAVKTGIQLCRRYGTTMTKEKENTEEDEKENGPEGEVEPMLTGEEEAEKDITKLTNCLKFEHGENEKKI